MNLALLDNLEPENQSVVMGFILTPLVADGIFFIAGHKPAVIYKNSNGFIVETSETNVYDARQVYNSPCYTEEEKNFFNQYFKGYPTIAEFTALTDTDLKQLKALYTINNDVRQVANSYFKEITPIFDTFTDADREKYVKGFLKRFTKGILTTKDKRRPQGIKGKSRDDFLKILDDFFKAEKYYIENKTTYSVAPIRRHAWRGMRQGLEIKNAGKVKLKVLAGESYNEIIKGENYNEVIETDDTVTVVKTKGIKPKQAIKAFEAAEAILNHYDYQDMLFVQWSSMEIDMFAAVLTALQQNINAMWRNKYISKGNEIEVIGEVTTTTKVKKHTLIVAPSDLLSLVKLPADKDTIKDAKQALLNLGSKTRVITGVDTDGAIIRITGNSSILNFKEIFRTVPVKQQEGENPKEETIILWKISNINGNFDFRLDRKKIEGGYIPLPLVQICSYINQNANDRQRDTLKKNTLYIFGEVRNEFDRVKAMKHNGEKEIKPKDTEISICNLTLSDYGYLREQEIKNIIGALSTVGITATVEKKQEGTKKPRLQIRAYSNVNNPYIQN